MNIKKKRIIQRSIGIVLLVAFLFFGTGMHISGDVQNCEKLKPLPTETSASYRKLDFSEKERISPNKFGFRQEIKVKEPSVVLLEIGGSTKYGYFGIYQDKNLQQAIEEIPFTWGYRNGGYEEGVAEYIPNEKGKDGIVLLQPGTYYIAVFTKKPFDSGEISYLSYIHPLNERCQLSEGENQTFYVVKEKQKNVLHFTADNDGKVKVSTNICFSGSMDVYDKQGRLLKQVVAKPEDKEPLSMVISVEKNHTYTVEISDLELIYDAFQIDLNRVKYEYI